MEKSEVSIIENDIRNVSYWLNKFQRTNDVTDLKMVEHYCKEVLGIVQKDLIELKRKEVQP